MIAAEQLLTLPSRLLFPEYEYLKQIESVVDLHAGGVSLARFQDLLREGSDQGIRTAAALRRLPRWAA